MNITFPTAETSVLSVIICTHNPNRAILNRVLESLSAQTLDQKHWELIVVDNASREALSQWLDVGWHGRSQITQENALGQLQAALKGISLARGEVLVFVDDDNFLDPDYLEKSLAVAEQWPILGAWGGQILPEFEQAPPAWTERYWPYLTILQCPYDQWSNLPDQNWGIPPGAGLVIRRPIALVYAHLLRNDPHRVLLDRRGKILTSGYDMDMVFTGCDLGYGAARLSSFALRHYMPAWRFEEDYLLRMVEDTAFSHRLRDANRGKGAPRISVVRRARQYLAGWTMRPRDRRFWHAQIRGLRRADRLIDEHPELRQPRDAREFARRAAREIGVRPFDCARLLDGDRDRATPDLGDAALAPAIAPMIARPRAV